ncbi:hypothetical protein [Pseudazoarcus pumilus]|uniref:Uncharacterized protein n=1 Tax=Pseudazoarcus pumilus TaxID=2067960 RepID=A0A2I6S7Z8_9RHOO|nr:hypothetical protein [Pseudazoarcus pumilus]AUN95399.1 hypothetical protein C0099_10955 [Pseudazoarcus pumilus]
MSAPELRLPHDAADESWVGVDAELRLPHDAADETWAPTLVTALVSVPSPLGAPAVVGEVLVILVEGVAAVPSPLGAPAARADVPVQARTSVPGPLGVPAVLGELVQTALAAVPSPLGAPAVVATVVRYELRGAVRDQGVLVERRVRAYRLDTGELVAQGDTSAGLFRLPVGFEARLFTVLSVHLDEAATDYAPPCANRVESVLAMDEVAA